MAPGCVCHRSQAVIKCCRFCPGGCLVTGQSPRSCLYRDICRAAAYNRWCIVLYYYIKCAGGCIAVSICKGICHCSCPYRERCSRCMAPGCICHRSQAVIQCCRFCPGGCLVTGQSPCSCLYRDICRAAAYNRWCIVLYYYIKCAGGCIASFRL